MQYGNMRFSADFWSATQITTGEELKFTKAESCLLAALIGSAGRVLNRARLLDAVSGTGSDVTERSIDFLVNRLRRKLGDSARSPTYIASRYGEGYVWVAEPPAAIRRARHSLLVVGPIHGLGAVGNLARAGGRFVRALYDHIDTATGPESEVSLDTASGPSASGSSRAEFGLSLSFLTLERGRLDAALALKRVRTGSVILVKRVIVRREEQNMADLALARDLSEEVTAALWQELKRAAESAAAPEDPPVPVGLYLAGGFLAETHASCDEAEARLRAALRRDPGDSQSKVMLALALHSRHVLAGPSFLRLLPRRIRDQAEIESLCTSALPDLMDNDLFVLAIAKLLWFATDRHRQLAIDLSEQAFRTTTALTTALATVGQLRMWRGEVSDGLSLVERGLELTDPHSLSRQYFLTLRLTGQLALGDDAGADRTAAMMCRLAPDMRGLTALLCERRDDPGAAADRDAAFGRLGAEGVRAMVLWQHHISARLFARATHAENVMRRPISFAVDRYGPDCIPEEVRRDLPGCAIIARRGHWAARSESDGGRTVFPTLGPSGGGLRS